ncbi:GDP-L-fucose synthase [candidate division WWE3 bacterium]|uniref:GDP-L-fucose synthase n=1 Tax=candidate division WWE3 bacterium TaxID=2053526 RepID=A0A955J247_UNCKA|nr:GDP-L-fucose synthase [candidate division WWE3 bacterium]
MNLDSKIYVAGHTGLVGSAIYRKLQEAGYTNIVVRSKKELDLMDSLAVANFFKEESPEYVFVAAAKVGGIMANKTYPADFIYQNLQIQNNIIHNAYLNNVTKLLFLGSTCIYPKLAPQPLKEEYLLTGPLEPTNDAYAIAKIAGIIMCQSYNRQHNTNYICAMPTNLYGPNDNFDLETSHVLPALIRRFSDAAESGDSSITIWGSGKPKREFLHVDDLADALLFLMQNYNDNEIINVGCGEDVSIMDLAKTVSTAVGFKGEILTDTSKPDGTPRKLVDVTKLFGLGWKPKIGLEDGIKSTYEWYLKNYK